MNKARSVEIGGRLEQLRARIRALAEQYGRAPDSVTLLAVSKTFPATDIVAACNAGQTRFGESYLQEAQEKIAQVNGHCTAAAGAPEWHFIGPLQSNKTRHVAELFDWAHSVDSFKLARRLSEQRPSEMTPLQCCLQVNISGEASKSGIPPAQLGELAARTAALPGLRVRGLMAIPARTDEPDAQRRAFAAVRTLFEDLRAQGLELDTLSMGMSGDLEAAIAEGSTLVRVGTGIFGARPPPAGT